MRSSMVRRLMCRGSLLFGACLLLVGLRPLPAHAGSPTPSELMRLDDRLLRTSRVRITTPSGKLLAGHARVSAEGIAAQNILTTGGDEERPVPDLVPWEQVLRVDRPSNRALGAALVTGVVLYAALGVATYAAEQRGEEAGGGGGMVILPVGVLLAAGVGALMPTWHPIYRNRDARKSER